MAQKFKQVTITNPPRAACLGRRATSSPTPPAPEPVTPQPRARVGERFKSSPSVRVTNPRAGI